MQRMLLFGVLNVQSFSLVEIDSVAKSFINQTRTETLSYRFLIVSHLFLLVSHLSWLIK